jgi:arginine exporter protein ArgO
MGHFQPILISGLTGFISGLLLSIPVGPVNLTIMNEARAARLLLGGAHQRGRVGDGGDLLRDCFTGFAQFFDNRAVKAGMEVFSFAFMLFLGVKFLMAKTSRRRCTFSQPPTRSRRASSKSCIRIRRS